MGCWNNNMKNGNGVVINHDGIYYEGVFSQNDVSVSLYFFIILFSP